MDDLSDILRIAKEILEPAGLKGMHVKDIAEQAVRENKNMGLSAEAFKTKVNAALAQNIKLKSKKPSFAQVNNTSGQREGKPKLGWYRVKFTRKTSVNPEPVPTPAKNFLGKAGEYAVMAELLFGEYKVSSMIVDEGVDIVASKDNRFFYVQALLSG